MVNTLDRRLSLDSASSSRTGVSALHDLLERFGLDGNVLLTFGALLPVFFYPGFVALAGGGVASGEGDGGDFGLGDLGALVARG